MSKFYNTYHFIPTTKRTNADASRDILAEDAQNGKWGVHGHDRYGKELFSGRLVCSLETETPIFIGAGQKDVDGQKVVDHFSMDGRPAIPGTSLRGMLSSLAEAASNSALRVLHRNQPLSFRYAMKQNMSALGMVRIIESPEGERIYRLVPLVMPSLDLQGNEYVYPPKFAQRKISYSRMFKHFDHPPLKVFINRSGHVSFQKDAPEFFYLKLDRSISFNESKTGVKRHPVLRFSSRDRDTRRTAIGQVGDMNPISEVQWRDLDVQERSLYTRGIVRVMKSRDRSDIPFGKKHELFIPYPVELEETAESFLISHSAIRQFTLLANQRSEDNPLHPYEPVGTRPNRNSTGLKLQEGDIVYFVPNDDGSEVAEISFSSIWRGYAGTVEDFFEKVDPELLPFTKKRTRITPAELLFGFVQDEKGKNSKSLAYKGKVRISCATLDGSSDNLFDREVTLKVLSSPKPPSPVLYFKPAGVLDGGQVSKAALKPGVHEPQGRKMYLHHPVKPGISPWQTAHGSELLNQKNRIAPLRSGLRFTFSVEFDNLNEWELGLLCYSVRPTEEFRHKIGMGKPIGLGTVRLEPKALQLVDRQHRYTAQGFLDTRHSPVKRNVKELCDLFCTTMSPDIANAIRLLGDPEKARQFPIHTPQIVNYDQEKETYRWFVANDNHRLIDSQRLFLKPLRAGLEELPHLDTPQQPPDAGQGGGHRAGGGPRNDSRPHQGGNRHNQGGNRNGGGNGSPRR